MRLLGKTAIVTGGTGNLGNAIVLKLLEEGADVVFTFLTNKNKVEILKTQARTLGRDIVPVKCDVRNYNEISEVIKSTINNFKKIDILVNNVAIDSRNSLFDTTDELWENTLNINLRGPHYFTKLVAPYMMKQKCGKIINISAVAGIIGAGSSSAVYSASKAGLIGLTKKWAVELGPYNISVNAIAPGVILRPTMNDARIEMIINRTPLRKVCKPEDIAKIVLFFASSDSDMVTGQVLIVDGGVITK